MCHGGTFEDGHKKIAPVEPLYPFCRYQGDFFQNLFPGLHGQCSDPLALAYGGGKGRLQGNLGGDGAFLAFFHSVTGTCPASVSSGLMRA